MKCRVAIVIREIHMVQTLSNSDHKSIFSLHSLTANPFYVRQTQLAYGVKPSFSHLLWYNLRSFREVVTRVAFSQQTFNFQSNKIWLYERELIHNTYMNNYYLKESMKRKHNLYICMSFMFICQKKNLKC